jgi:hypothetical protein
MVEDKNDGTERTTEFDRRKYVDKLANAQVPHRQSRSGQSF